MKCNSCGGSLVYNIEQKCLACVQCDSTFPVKQYRETEYFEAYGCSSCGAEVTAPADQAVAYCNYCGGQVVLKGRVVDAERPTRIIPFTKTKAEAMERYKEAVEKEPYLPAEFKEAQFLEGFRGIYIPYWRKKLHVSQTNLTLKGSKDYTIGQYDYHEEYDIYTEIGGRADDCYYDASVAFDDTVAGEIAPFDVQKTVDYCDGYLAGFYADRASAPAKTYDDSAVSMTRKIIRESIDRQSEPTLRGDSWEEKVEIRNEGATVSLFPVWFLTWRKADRVAYAVMNGQTGKMSIDLPVDRKSFFKWSAIWSVVLFVLLSVLPIFILPLHLAGITTTLMVGSSLLLGVEIRNIFWQEQHTFDLGYQQMKREDGEPVHAKMNSGVRAGDVILCILFFVAMVAACMTETPDGTRDFLMMLLVLELPAAISIAIRTFRLKRKLAWLSIPVTYALQLAACLLAGAHHPHDYWYYGIAAASLIGMIVNVLIAFFYMNDLATRPVPNFFTREGANNRYES